MIEEIESHHLGENRAVVEAYLESFEAADIAEKGDMLKKLRLRSAGIALSKSERKSLKKVYKQDLAKRSLALRIVAAWLITAPASALLAAMVFYMLRGLLL
jgi:PiT family inorganic phosphate transporter